MHRQLIVHRDLKLENIFMSDFTSDAKVQIGDFGSAIKLTSPQQKVKFRIGTAGFIAPEVAERQPYSFKTDIFSLGCIMYTVLFGESPFWSDDSQERERLLLDRNMVFTPSALSALNHYLSKDCTSLITQMLEKD